VSDGQADNLRKKHFSSSNIIICNEGRAEPFSPERAAELQALFYSR